MFSHLLANLVLREIDLEFATDLPAAYFRYVDDIALVGEKADVDRALQTVRSRLASLGLTLHEEDSPKNLEVSCKEWLPSRGDFSEKKGGISWMHLIGSLKRYLLQHPGDHEMLREAFGEKGFRIPIRDYSSVIREQEFVQQILRLAPWNWFKKRMRSLSVSGLIASAENLREDLYIEFQQASDGASILTGFERKRRISKIRYCIARLVYLATDDKLRMMADTSVIVPELFFHSQVMRAISSKRIDRVIAMGTNAAQATAQPMRAAGVTALLASDVFQKAKEQSLAVFLMNGVAVDRPLPAESPESELIRFAGQGTDQEMMKSNEGFFREIACLHGLSSKPRHVGVFDRAFDEDEALTMDAVIQLQQSMT
jgi:hypothetical protein